MGIEMLVGYMRVSKADGSQVTDLQRDALLAAGLVVAFSEPGFDPYHHDSGTVWAAAGVLGAAALAWRRAAPRAVWLITTVTATWLLLRRHGTDWGGLSPLVLIPASLAGLYTLASRTERRASLAAAVVTVAALEAGLLADPIRPEAAAMVVAASTKRAGWTKRSSTRAPSSGVNWALSASCAAASSLWARSR